MNLEKYPKIKKLNRWVLCFAVPLLAAAAILYALFAPAAFQLNENYYFARGDASGDLRTGGKTLLRDARLWGRYPYVYGSGVMPGESARVSFLLDLKENKLRTFSEAETNRPGNEFDAFLLKHGVDMTDCRVWSELYEPADAGRELRRKLKKSLETPSAQKKFLFF